MAHILLVEDDEEVVEFTRSLLDKHGYSVEIAPDGEEALRAYMSRRPDLILLDIFVPRLDGLRFAREIRTRYPGDRTPIVVWTGAYEPDSMGDLLDTPHVLPKPVSSEELLEVVHRALGVETRARALRALVVSSQPATLRALVRDLRSEFDVHTASGWEEALALVDMRPFEAVVVDLAGEPKDGAGVLRALAARHKEVARIGILGDGQEALARELTETGAAEALVTGPLAAGALAERLHSIVG